MQLAWLIPVLSFSIMTGLALDYDIFLVSRIIEYRQRGFDEDSAIAIG